MTPMPAFSAVFIPLRSVDPSSRRCPRDDPPGSRCFVAFSLEKALSLASNAVSSMKMGSRERSGSTVPQARYATRQRSEEHTSELQSHLNLVCRLLLEKKKKKKI